MRNLILYGIIDYLASGTDALLFYVLTYMFGTNPFASNCLTALVCIFVSFALNHKLNFKIEDHTARRAPLFFSVGFAELLLSEGILALSVILNVEVIVAKLISIIIFACFQFTLDKFVSIVIVACSQFTMNKFVSFGFGFEQESPWTKP